MAKYIDIARTLSDRIARSVYPANSYLPSEAELRQEFDASRDTVRKALNLLAERKKIFKEHGKGSKVLEPDVVTFPSAGLTSFKELASLSDQDIQTSLIEFTQTSDPRILQLLQMPAGSRAQKIVRVRSYDGQRVILDTDYINPQVIPGLTASQARDSIYEYIEKALELPIGFARKEITVEPAGIREKELLDLDDDSLLVVVRSWSYLEDATLFEYTESRHRPDKFKFLDFSRRERL